MVRSFSSLCQFLLRNKKINLIEYFNYTLLSVGLDLSLLFAEKDFNILNILTVHHVVYIYIKTQLSNENGIITYCMLSSKL